MSSRRRLEPPDLHPLPARRIASRGFTLIELLVVLIIIGVMATMVTLSIGGGGEERMKAESQRLAQLFKLASDEAQINGVEIGFRNTDQGFDFLTLQSNGTWEPVEEGPFRPRPIEQPLYLELRVEGHLVKPAHIKVGSAAKGRNTPSSDDGEAAKDKDKDKKFFDNAAHQKAEDKPAPQVLIMSTGEMSAFTLDLRTAGNPNAFRLEGNELGELTNSRLAAKK